MSSVAYELLFQVLFQLFRLGAAHVTYKRLLFNTLQTNVRQFSGLQSRRPFLRPFLPGPVVYISSALVSGNVDVGGVVVTRRSWHAGMRNATAIL